MHTPHTPKATSERGKRCFVERVGATVVIKPKNLVDARVVLTPEEERVIHRGESKHWKQIKHEMDL